MRPLPIKGVALLVAMELVTLESEHTETSVCHRRGNEFPFKPIRWAWQPRELLGCWPLPAAAARR